MATCTMEGDAFEMEDQRNWSDASYKTYVRPLTRPWPYTLPKGEKVAQSVTLSISGKLPARAGGTADRPVMLTLGGEIGRLPAIGLGIPADEAAHALEKGALTQRLGVQSLICEIDLRRDHGREEMDRYRALADLTGAAITLEIITKGSLNPDAELAAVAKASADAGLTPACGHRVSCSGHGFGSTRRALARNAELRRDLCCSAQGVPRLETRWGHGCLFYRAKSQAPALGVT